MTKIENDEPVMVVFRKDTLIALADIINSLKMPILANAEKLHKIQILIDSGVSLDSIIKGNEDGVQQ